MIRIEHLHVFNLDGAVRSTIATRRKDYKSDSKLTSVTEYSLGQNDLQHMRLLCAAGPEHRTFMRQILMCFDLTAPIYFWSFFDAYTEGVVVHPRTIDIPLKTLPLTVEDFSTDGWSEENINDRIIPIIHDLNAQIVKYEGLDTGEKGLSWREIIGLLPSCFNVKRTVTCSYETILNIVCQKSQHAITEWQDFICHMETHLPYFKILAKEVEF
jgi:hypothetical protein